MRISRTHPYSGSQWALIITDDAGFGRELSACWQNRPDVPEFTTISSEGSEFVGIESLIGVQGYDLAIVGHVDREDLLSVVGRFEQTPALLVWTPPGMSPEVIREEVPDVMALRESEDMVESTVTIGAELLLRTSCQKKLTCTERLSHEDKIHAALGRYMIGCRHSFSNALTSVLGTAELMQIADLRSRDRFRDHLKTIHMGALRMQSLLQHFSVLEAEMLLERTRDSGSSEDMNVMAHAAHPEGSSL
jgi:signal transduction histidine kinase